MREGSVVRKDRISLRKGAVLSAVLAAALYAQTAGAQSTSAKALQQTTGDFAAFQAEFQRPTQTAKPTIRYWLPGAHVDAAIVRKDVTSIAQAGFGSVELADLPQNVGSEDPATYGWGTKAMRDAMKAAMQSAVDNHITFSITIGPSWPAAASIITPDSAGAAKELVYGTALLKAGQRFDALLPEPLTKAAPTVHDKRLIALQAWQCAHECQEQDAIVLKPGSLQDLTGAVHDGALAWTAPGEGNWILIAYWERGTGEGLSLALFPSNPPAAAQPMYTVDHFGKDGALAIIEEWNAKVLDESMRVLIRKAGYALFEDSLELSATQKWTPSLLESFKRMRGYDLQPLLPFALVDTARNFGAPRSYKPHFRLQNEEPGDLSVFRDYQRTLSDLYVKNHLEPLAAFAHSLGFVFRAQPYSEPFDMGKAAAALDVPEGENLTLNNEQDIFRLLATGGHIRGSQVLSTECCSELMGTYRQSWQDMLATFHLQYAAGVNQVVLHGFPYSGAVATAHWPGWDPFEPFPAAPFIPIKIPNGFSDAFGPRQPSWADVPMLANYIARTQTLLRTGAAVEDVAWVNDTLDRDQGPILKDQTLRLAGYSYGFVSSYQLMEAHATFANEKVRVGKAEFGALLVDGSVRLRAEAVTKLQALVEAGAVVLVVDAQSNFGSLPRVANIAGAINALKAHHIAASVSRLPAAVEFVHRKGANADYYYLYNEGKQTVEQSVAVAGSGKPYLLSGWSGSAIAVRSEGAKDGFASVPLRLESGDATLVVVTPATLAASAEEAPTNTQQLTLDHWQLQLEQWTPAADKWNTEIGALPSQELTQLAPWPSLQGAEHVSGRGRYTTHFALPQNVQSSTAVLELPAYEGLLTLKVNGQSVPVDLLSHQVALGAAAHAGDNELVITVASTLNNQLRVADSDTFGGFPAQPYGLNGSVSIRYGTR